MTGWQLYWILRLDTINATAGGIAGGFGCLFCIGLIIYIIMKIGNQYDEDEDLTKVAKALGKYLIIFLCCFVFTLMAALFIPTTKQAAAIIVVPKIINNESVKKLPDNLVELANEWVKTQTKNLKEE